MSCILLYHNIKKIIVIKDLHYVRIKSTTYDG